MHLLNYTIEYFSFLEIIKKLSKSKKLNYIRVLKLEKKIFLFFILDYLYVFVLLLKQVSLQIVFFVK